MEAGRATGASIPGPDEFEREYPQQIARFRAGAVASFKNPFKGPSHVEVLMRRFRETRFRRSGRIPLGREDRAQVDAAIASLGMPEDPDELLAAWRAWPGCSRALVLGSGTIGDVAGYPVVYVDPLLDDGSRLVDVPGECLWFYADELVPDPAGSP